MLLVEKHIIDKYHKLYQEIDQLCFLSKNLYNKALYTVRQEFISTSKLKEEGKRERANYFNYYSINRQFIDNEDFDYYKLPGKISNQTLMMLDKNFKSFFALCKMYSKDKSSLNGRPKLPKYLHKTKGRFLTTYELGAISTKYLKKGIIKLSNTNIEIPVINNRNGKLKQVRLVPMRNSRYKIEVIYDVEELDLKLNKTNYLSIDYGINNLMTITSNVEDFKPLIIKGSQVKNINQYYNNKKAKLQSELPNNPTLKDVNGKPRQLHSSKKIENLTHKRNCKIDNLFHQYTNQVIELCEKYNIGTIVVGVNKGWKDEADLGKRNNQNFVSIPYTKLTNQLKYKSQLISNIVIEQEESYTSKASFVDDDFIPTYNKKKPKSYIFSGVRNRGLYITKSGAKINSDVNGSYNILKKYMLSINEHLDITKCSLTPRIIKI
jgi:putative transposase